MTKNMVKPELLNIFLFIFLGQWIRIAQVIRFFASNSFHLYSVTKFLARFLTTHKTFYTRAVAFLKLSSYQTWVFCAIAISFFLNIVLWLKVFDKHLSGNSLKGKLERLLDSEFGSIKYFLFWKMKDLEFAVKFSSLHTKTSFSQF